MRIRHAPLHVRIALHACVLIACASLSPRCSRSSSAGAPDPGAGAAPARAASGPVDACALLPTSEIAAIVGNAVEQGQPFAGVEVCKWDAEPGRVTALLTVRRAGSDREKVLCAELGKGVDAGQRITELGRVATWTFSNTMGLFNSGELESCGDKGYVSVTLNGKQDEAKLKEGSVAIARRAFKGL
jgi:hypothetical protein